MTMHASAPLPSHPFISFADFDSSYIPARTWLLLGETFSKCKHLSGAPLAPAVAREMGIVYLAAGAQATTAIEGNTLSTNEVRKIVEEGTADVGVSRQYLEQEVKNVLSATREIWVALQENRRIPITVDRLCQLNQQVLQDVPEDQVVPGELRTEGRDVMVGNAYRPPAGRDVGMLAKEFEDWLRRLRGPAEAPGVADEDRFVSAVLSAILAHLYIAWIHPFDNGNGRTARLVEVQILAESGVVPIISTQLLSNHFNNTRDAYYRALNHARTDATRFIQYAVEGFADGLREQINLVRRQNLELVWRSYVHETFDHEHKDTEARRRQRKLAMALPDGESVSPEQATELSPKLTRIYAKAGDRMPARDLGELVRLGLATKTGRRMYMANRDVILGLVPPVSS